jgi:CheY-like chemotaxis protein
VTTGPEFRHQHGASSVRTVLIVEDNFEVRSVTAEWLRMHDFHVIEAVNSVEAASVLCSQVSVDLVFSDVYMPRGIDGFDLAQWIAKQRPGIPVLLTSGKPEESSKATQGAVPFLRKPYEPEALLRRIESMLRSSP